MSRNDFVPVPLPGLPSSRPPSSSSSRQTRPTSFHPMSGSQLPQPHQQRSAPSTSSRPVPPPSHRSHWQIVLHDNGAGGTSSSSSTATRTGSAPSSPVSPPSNMGPPPSPSHPNRHPRPSGSQHPAPPGGGPNNSHNSGSSKPPKLHRCPHPNCDVSFAQKSHANSHYKAVHENLKPYKCEECSLAFNKRFDLNSHRAAVHDKSRDHQCPRCSAAFAKKSNLTRHMQSVHSGPGGSGSGGSNAMDSSRHGGGSSGHLPGHSGSRNLSFVGSANFPLSVEHRRR